MVAPIVPALNDSEIEAILKTAQEAGAREAGYVLLFRLPELKELFKSGSETDFPDRASFRSCKACTAAATTSRRLAIASAVQGPYAITLPLGSGSP
ncbi:MAG: hypothetical protein R3D67_19160 [Hyphomicrobiaceae bacterium]